MFITLIKLIIGRSSARLEKLLFQFNTSIESLKFNRKVLEVFDYDMEKLVLVFRKVISLGSEFRSNIIL